MIKAILSGIMKLIIGLVSIILAPIDLLIEAALPELSSAFTAIGSFLTIVSSGIGWCISLTGLSSNAISLLVAYYVFTLTAPLGFYMIKLALNWYNRLKP